MGNLREVSPLADESQQQDPDQAELERLAALSTPVVSIPEVPVTPPEVEESIAETHIPEDPDTNQAEPIVDSPPVDSGRNDMSHDPTHQPTQPDAGNDKTFDFVSIVNKYMSSDEHAFSAEMANSAIINERNAWIAAHPNLPHDEVDREARNAKLSINWEKDQRDEAAVRAANAQREQEAAQKAKTPPPPATPVIPTAPIVEPVAVTPASASGGGGITPPVLPPINIIMPDNNGNNGNSNVPAIIGGGLLGLLLLILGGAFITWLATRDDDSNVPASSGGTALTIDTSACPAEIKATCNSVAADYAAGKINQAEAQRKLSEALAKASVNTGGNTAGASSTTGGTNSTGGAINNLLDGRSYEARTTKVDSDLGFPPYEDTGIGQTKSWAFTVPNGYVLLAFGVIVVDNKTGESHNRGFIKAYGPGAAQFTITDGAYKVVPLALAEGEWCVRIKQHQDNGWLLTEASWLTNKLPVCGS